MGDDMLNNIADGPTNSVQFRLLHLCYVMLSFSIAGAIVSWERGLGITLLVLTAGFWIGYVLLGISNLIDAREFDDRKLWSQLIGALGTLLIAACATFGMILIALILLAAGAWLIG